MYCVIILKQVNKKKIASRDYCSEKYIVEELTHFVLRKTV